MMPFFPEAVSFVSQIALHVFQFITKAQLKFLAGPVVESMIQEESWLRNCISSAIATQTVPR